MGTQASQFTHALTTRPSQVSRRQKVLGAWNTAGTTERKLPGPWVCTLVKGGQQTHRADRPGDTCACRQGRGGTRVCRTGCCSTHFSLATSGHVIYLSPRGGGSPAWCQGGWEQAALGTAAFCTEGPSEQRAGWQGGREPLDVRGEGAPGRGHHKSRRWEEVGLFQEQWGD